MALELTTVELIQDYLSDITISTSTLTTLAQAAEAAIARKCGRFDTVNGSHWLSASHTEYFDGDMAQNILLKFTPVTGVSSVTITTSASGAITVATTNLDLDGIAIANLSVSSPGIFGRLGWRQTTTTVSQWFDYGFPRPNWMWSVGSPNFGDGRNRVAVTYTGGFSVAPDDLKLGATMLAAKMYRERSRDPALIAERLGAYSREWSEGDGDDKAMGGLLQLIGPYMRTVC